MSIYRVNRSNRALWFRDELQRRLCLPVGYDIKDNLAWFYVRTAENLLIGVTTILFSETEPELLFSRKEGLFLQGGKEMENFERILAREYKRKFKISLGFL